MIKIKNNLLIVLILFFFSQSSLASSITFKDKYLYKYSTNDQVITISRGNYKRLQEFFLGKFFSYEQNNFQTMTNGAYFALSKTGIASVMSYCNEEINNCILDNMKFVTKAKCERIANEECFIIVSDNKIILNRQYYSVDKKTIPDHLTSKFQIFDKNSEEKISDIRLTLYRDYGSENWD